MWLDLDDRKKCTNLIHKRIRAVEITVPELWGLDGRSIWCDWQYLRGEEFFLVGYRLDTHRRIAYPIQRNEWSIHCNLTPGETLLTGDGGGPGQIAKAPDWEWSELFHPELLTAGPGALNDLSFWQPGVFHAEHLINMAHRNYRLEQDVRFSPDGKLSIFTSNMLGPDYAVTAEEDTAVNPSPSEIRSIPDFAAQFNAAKPVPM